MTQDPDAIRGKSDKFDPKNFKNKNFCIAKAPYIKIKMTTCGKTFALFAGIMSSYSKIREEIDQ